MKTGEASSTAKLIAAATIALARDAATARLVSPGAAALCERLLSGTRADRWLARSARWAPTRALWRAVERLTLPGIAQHYWHRKRWIEQRCRVSLLGSVQRLVVLGAGFDTLGLRLAAEFPALAVVELDHPATQSAKQRALARSGAPVPTNLQFEPCDLAHEPLPAVVTMSRLSTLYVAEGLLMYLPPERVEALFVVWSAGFAPRQQVVFSFMTRWPDGGTGFRPRSALVERWLAWRGEPFVWALPPQALKPLLDRHGMNRVAFASTPEFTPAATAATRPGQAALDGENLVFCEAFDCLMPAETAPPQD